MLDRYRREARLFEELELGTLGPLDALIPELVEPGSTPAPPSGSRTNVSESVGRDRRTTAGQASDARIETHPTVASEGPIDRGSMQLADASMQDPTLLIPLIGVRIPASEQISRGIRVQGFHWVRVCGGRRT